MEDEEFTEEFTSAESKRKKRISPKKRFRALVRLVIANTPWLLETGYGTKYGGKKILKSNLTLEHKAILNKAPEDRTNEENDMIYRTIGGFKCFRKYPEHVKMMLANFSHFAYFGPDRIIVRQHHVATAMFFIVSGEVNIIEEEYDAYLNETERVVTETLAAGDGFGEISLLHNLPRMETIISVTPVEFLVLNREDFDVVLKKTVKEEWDHISSLMLTFEYFQGWDKVRLGEACTQALVKNYKKDDTILGDGYGRKNYVHFVIAGSCSLIEHLFVEETKYQSGRSSFRQYIPGSGVNYSGDLNMDDDFPKERSIMDSRTSEYHLDDRELTLKAPIKGSSTFPALSFHADLGEKRNRKSLRRASSSLLVEDSSSVLLLDYTPVNVQTIFMQVCIFSKTACFSLGESMRNRRIIADEDCVCLLIPAYLLLGRDTIWLRIKQFLSKSIPSSEKVFEEFARQRKWRRYRTEMVRPMLRSYCTNWYGNIPYTTRIHNDYNFKPTRDKPKTRRELN